MKYKNEIDALIEFGLEVIDLDREDFSFSIYSEKLHVGFFRYSYLDKPKNVWVNYYDQRGHRRLVDLNGGWSVLNILEEDKLLNMDRSIEEIRNFLYFMKEPCCLGIVEKIRRGEYLWNWSTKKYYTGYWTWDKIWFDMFANNQKRSENEERIEICSCGVRLPNLLGIYCEEYGREGRFRAIGCII